MGKRRSNGEGSIYETIKKNKRKVFLNEECETCRNCTQKCNRLNFEKCDKCKNCKDCLKYCDRFYCYRTVEAQVNHKSIARGTKEKEVRQKKQEREEELNIAENIRNKELSLIDTMKYNENTKLKYNLIGENSYCRNKDTISAIEKHPSANIQMAKLTEYDIKSILSYFININCSQSQLDKVYDEIKGACNISNLSSLFCNIKRNTFISCRERKEVVAFTLQEEQMLLNYINQHEDMLIINNKSNIDRKTIKNLIKHSLATGMRIGESCSLSTSNIDFDNSKVSVSITLTRDKDGNIIKGTQTKTGRKARKRGKSDKRLVPFDILFSKEEMEELYREQISIAKSISNNTEHLLFCTNEGKYITHSSFNAIFKRICRQAGIKLELPQGCHSHMCKHTAVSRMIELGINIRVISKIVGTSVEELDKTYAHILDEFIEAEIDKSKKVSNGLNINVSLNNIVPFVTK